MRTKRRPFELDVTSFPSEYFTVIREGDQYHMSAFASDLGVDPTGKGLLQRFYNDACDVGIAICSKRTGAVVRFCLSQEEERDGEVVAWHFGPTPYDDAKGVARVTVWND
jgi:hypothetical protein